MAEDGKGTGGGFELGRTEQGFPLVRLSGDWVLRTGMTSADQILGSLDPGAKFERVVVDGSGVGHWDSALVSLLVQLRQTCEARGIEMEPRNIPDGLRRLVDLALAVPEKAGARRGDKTPSFVESVGHQALDALRSSGDMLTFLGEAMIALGNAIRRRARFRPSDVLLVLQECGPQALPIVTLISFLVGMILAFVGLVQLKQFGADIFVANLVAVAMVREMGGMMTGIIMAGRTGAAFAAQLGTMNVNDEIAAHVGADLRGAALDHLCQRGGHVGRFRRGRAALGCVAAAVLCADIFLGDPRRLGWRSLQIRHLRHHHRYRRLSARHAMQ
jgi:phospholipid/cholesterol/gamma-HCH transport system permease protein